MLGRMAGKLIGFYAGNGAQAVVKYSRLARKTGRRARQACGRYGAWPVVRHPVMAQRAGRRECELPKKTVLLARNLKYLFPTKSALGKLPPLGNGYTHFSPYNELLDVFRLLEPDLVDPADTGASRGLLKFLLAGELLRFDPELSLSEGGRVMDLNVNAGPAMIKPRGQSYTVSGYTGIEVDADVLAGQRRVQRVNLEFSYAVGNGQIILPQDEYSITML